jgi:hypothetical protein
MRNTSVLKFEKIDIFCMSRYDAENWIRVAFPLVFSVQFWCSFGAESVILHGLYGQFSPNLLDCMDAVILGDTGWKSILLTSNQ